MSASSAEDLPVILSPGDYLKAKAKENPSLAIIIRRLPGEAGVRRECERIFADLVRRLPRFPRYSAEATAMYLDHGSTVAVFIKHELCQVPESVDVGAVINDATIAVYDNEHSKPVRCAAFYSIALLARLFRMEE